MLLEGLQLPLTTPFYPDGRLNLRKLEHNAVRYSKTPVAGLVALSEPGEATMLSDGETRQALQSVVDAAGAEKVLMAGVSRDSVVGTLDLVEFAAELGYDAVLVKRPSGMRASAQGVRAKELLNYFQMIADRSTLPVVLYSPEEDRDGGLPAEIVVELAAHPKIIGLVDGAGGPERTTLLKTRTSTVKYEVTVTPVFAAVTGRMQSRGGGASAGALISADSLTDEGAAVAVAPARAVARTRKKVVGFQILAGSTGGVLEGLQAGAVGAMSAFAASAPQACYEVMAAWKDGDEGLAAEKQLRLRAVAERVEAELGVAGVKYGCDLNGYYGGLPRLPLLPLTGAERSELEALMQGLGN
jgi:4-hydroxy-2-oxoglutarate aldolase